ncbi:hypothetical protein K461DRAFT_82120 [Myriangium duriaei CBS 260.36]|uniref:Uncharacterized protein n=1 Tax=Myriangium duriaei CBS 260.36 TaxID=1168546 RepID=A0A9P4J838_9PEZI|nr:hypothetical protein K461DRAFT_82120 [Myriangium duriaei CBS 260.36]
MTKRGPACETRSAVHLKPTQTRRRRRSSSTSTSSDNSDRNSSSNAETDATGFSRGKPCDRQGPAHTRDTHPYSPKNAVNTACHTPRVGATRRQPKTPPRTNPIALLLELLPFPVLILLQDPRNQRPLSGPPASRSRCVSLFLSRYIKYITSPPPELGARQSPVVPLSTSQPIYTTQPAPLHEHPRLYSTRPSDSPGNAQRLCDAHVSLAILPSRCVHLAGTQTSASSSTFNSLPILTYASSTSFPSRRVTSRTTLLPIHV